jgi:hypothetical protein
MITSEIGFNAGKVWEYLDENKEQPVKDLIKKLKLPTNDFYMALGWLSREGKLSHKEQDGVMIVSLR